MTQPCAVPSRGAVEWCAMVLPCAPPWGGGWIGMGVGCPGAAFSAVLVCWGAMVRPMRYVVCAVLVGLSVSACSSGSDTAESVTSSPGRPRSTYAPATQDPEEWERVPAKDRDAFLAVLERADP